MLEENSAKKYLPPRNISITWNSNPRARRAFVFQGLSCRVALVMKRGEKAHQSPKEHVSPGLPAELIYLDDYEHRHSTAAVSPTNERIGTHGALHSRSAMPWRFNRCLTSSWQFRLPSTGLAKAMDPENVMLLGIDFAML